jgi:hypothetical protein
VDPASGPDAAEVARARTLAGACLALVLTGGTLWSLTALAMLLEAVRANSVGANLELFAVFAGACTQALAAALIWIGLARRPPMLNAGLVAGGIGGILVAAPLILTVVNPNMAQLGGPILRLLYLDCAGLPLLAAGFCVYTGWHYRRLFRSGAARASPD